MSGFLIFACLVVSLAGLAYLALTDPKRRRTHGQEVLDRRPYLWPARIALFGPGVLLTGLGHWSGLTIWAGAVTTLGWLIAALSPATYAGLVQDVRRNRMEAWDWLKAMAQTLFDVPARYVPERLKAWTLELPRMRKISPGRTQPAEVEELKARITALEARLYRLEHGEEPMTTLADEHEDDDLTTKQPAKPLDAAE